MTSDHLPSRAPLPIDAVAAPFNRAASSPIGDAP